MAAWSDDDEDDRGPSALTAAAPWLAVLALVLAAATIGYLLIRGGAGAGDLTACRTAAWQAIPDKTKMPTGWTLDSTDLNANGITVSFVGSAADETSNPPVVYASITCYGDAAETALQANRDAAKAARSTIEERTGASDAFDISNPTTGSTTTVFRVGTLVAQVADSGDERARADLDAISAQVAAAMGDRTAAGTSGNAPDGGAGSSDEPLGSDVPVESTPPFAPELEAAMPTSIVDPTPGAASGSTIKLSVVSASATDVFADANDPGTRALSARIRSLGKTMDDLEYAQSFDESGVVTVDIRGFRLPGVDPAKLRAAITETWLSSTAAGVKTDQVTIAGKSVTRIDYGDQSALEYVVQVGDVVIDIETDDPAVAGAVLAVLK